MKLLQFLEMVYAFEGKLVVVDEDSTELATTRFDSEDFSKVLSNYVNHEVDHLKPYVEGNNCILQITVNTPKGK